MEVHFTARLSHPPLPTTTSQALITWFFSILKHNDLEEMVLQVQNLELPDEDFLPFAEYQTFLGLNIRNPQACRVILELKEKPDSQNHLLPVQMRAAGQEAFSMLFKLIPANPVTPGVRAKEVCLWCLEVIHELTVDNFSLHDTSPAEAEIGNLVGLHPANAVVVKVRDNIANLPRILSRHARARARQHERIQEQAAQAALAAHAAQAPPPAPGPVLPEGALILLSTALEATSTAAAAAHNASVLTNNAIAAVNAAANAASIASAEVFFTGVIVSYVAQMFGLQLPHAGVNGGNGGDGPGGAGGGLPGAGGGLPGAGRGGGPPGAGGGRGGGPPGTGGGRGGGPPGAGGGRGGGPPGAGGGLPGGGLGGGGPVASDDDQNGNADKGTSKKRRLE